MRVSRFLTSLRCHSAGSSQFVLGPFLVLLVALLFQQLPLAVINLAEGV
jgi:hypothetical protein